MIKKKPRRIWRERRGSGIVYEHVPRQKPSPAEESVTILFDEDGPELAKIRNKKVEKGK